MDLISSKLGLMVLAVPESDPVPTVMVTMLGLMVLAVPESDLVPTVTVRSLFKDKEWSSGLVDIDG